MTDIAGLPLRVADRGSTGPVGRADLQIVPLKALPIVAIVFAAASWPSRRTSFGRSCSCTSRSARRGRLSISFSASSSARSWGVCLCRRASSSTTQLMPKTVLIMPTLVTVTLAAGWQLGTVMGTVDSTYFHHGWIVASYIVVACMAVIALGLLSPANIAVLFELKKPAPNPAMIQRLMKRFIYAAGVTGTLQFAILVIMTQDSRRMSERALPPVTALGMASLALILAGGIYLAAHLPRQVPLAPAVGAARCIGARARDESRAAWPREGFRVAPFFRSASGRCSRTSITAGLIEYAFLRDGLSGGPLVVLTLSIACTRCTCRC